MALKQMVCVIPSRLAVGEEFSLKVRLLGEVRDVPCAGGFSCRKPNLRGPYNLNVQRQIQFVDNVLPEFEGVLSVESDGLSGPSEIKFNGKDQGIYPGDKRPIKVFDGFSFTEPGFHFIKLTDKESGTEVLSNPVYVTEEKPAERIFWGDPHWQTFFSDGIRCPEELYAFARDEGFLDFGAISDHVEALTDRQWEYFVNVTNDYNEPGRFATLVGMEWTHHNPDKGAPGHRNIYYRGDHGPVIRSNDPDTDTIEKLWTRLDSLPEDIEAVAIPHHSANKVMGVKWEMGWNEKYEKAVEVYSVWGSSEKPESAGNLYPIRALEGEMNGRHITNALNMGYRMGFVGGGDIHDGRPGHALHNESYKERSFPAYDEGLTAVIIPELTRENVFDAIRNGKTYASTLSRIYLDAQYSNGTYNLKTASEDGIKEAALVKNGGDMETFKPESDTRIVIQDNIPATLEKGDFIYFRITTEKGNTAWSSPVYAE